MIDDDPNLRKLYQIEFEAEGYKVILAENGENALKLLRENKVDLVTLDIRMPKMDGLEFLGEVRKIDMNLPIIIYTAYLSYKQDFQAWGADDYVLKSGDLTELKMKIKDVLAS